MEPIIAWSAPEHHYVEKGTDWYWAVGIVAFTGAALAIMFGQVIFGILIVISAVTLVLHASVEPRVVDIAVTDRGIIVADKLYTFLNLESFWIDPHQYPTRVLVKSQKTFMPFITLHIPEGVDPEAVRQVLLTYIAETEHEEPFTQKLMERLGF